MPNDFDDPIAQEIADRRKLTAETQASIGPVDAIADRIASRRRVALATSVQNGAKVNPDTRARAMELSDAMRLPVDMVERNMPMVEAKARASQYDMDSIRANHPQLAEWLSKPDNAAVSNDDLPAMRQLDVATRALAGEDPTGILPNGFTFSGGAILEPVGDGSMANQYKTVNDLIAELERRGNRDEIERINRQEAANRLNDRFGPASNVVAGIAGSIDATQRAVGTATTDSERAADDLTQASVELSPGMWGDIQRGVGGIIADIPLMAAGGGIVSGVSALTRLGKARSQVSALMKASAKGKGAEGAALLAGERAIAEKALVAAQKAAPLTGRAADFAKAAGSSLPLAAREGINVGEESGAINGALAFLIETAVPGAFGRTGAERYLTRGAGEVVADGWSGAIKRLLIDAGMEGSEEAVTEWAHAVHEKASGINPKALDPDRLWHRMAVAGFVGAAAGGGISLPAQVAEKFAREGEEAHRAEVYRDRMQYVVDQLAKSKTNGRSPAAVAEMMGKVLNQGDGFTYVDAAAFREAHVDPAAAAAAMGISQEYVAALALGGKMQIPTAALLQRASIDPEAAKLLDHASRSAKTMSAAQAAEFNTNAPDKVGKLHAEARRQADATKGASEETAADVAKNIEKQLIKAGTPADTAKTQAAIWGSTYHALSKRTGRPAMELFASENLRIKRELPKLLRGEKYDYADSMLDRIRSGDVPDDRAVHGPSLGDFLRTKGLRDMAYHGELKTLAESDRSRKPGERNLVRDDGISLDSAREIAVDRGYFPKDGTLAEFMTAIDNEVRGNSPSFAEGQGDPTQGAVRDALDQMEAALREAGVDIASATNKQAREALAKLVEDQEGNTLNQSDPAAAPMADTIDIDGAQRSTLNSDGKRIAQTEEQVRNFWKWFGDSKVADAQGRPLVVYHGASAVFDTFDAGKIGKTNGRSEGPGFYFSTDRTIGEMYAKRAGGNLVAAYLKISKPISFRQKNLSAGKMGTLLEELAKNEMKADSEIENWQDTYLANFVYTPDFPSLKAAAREAAKSFNGGTLLDQIGGIIGSGIPASLVGESVTAATGYDGYVSDGFGGEGVNGGVIWIATDPTKIKSATANHGTFDGSDPKIFNQTDPASFGNVVDAPRSGRLDLDALKQAREALATMLEKEQGNGASYRQDGQGSSPLANEPVKGYFLDDGRSGGLSPEQDETSAGGQPLGNRVEARRRQYDEAGQQTFLSPEGEAERELARGDIKPRDDAALMAVLNGEGGQLGPIDRVSRLLDGYTKDEIPNVVPLRGATVRSPQDAAALLAAYRSPFSERTTWLLLGADGKVKHNGLWAVGSIDGALIPTSSEMTTLLDQLEVSRGDIMIWAHNHPSGNPTPSQADGIVYHGMFKDCLKRGVRFQGIVLNGDSFNHGGYETPDYRSHTTETYSGGKEFYKAKPGAKLTGAQAIAGFVKSLAIAPGATIAIHLTPRLEVVGIESWQEAPTLEFVAASRASVAGAQSVIVTPNGAPYFALKGANDGDARLVDVIEITASGDYRSLRLNGQYRPPANIEKDNLLNIVHEGGSAVDAPKSGRLDLDALHRQWGRATGERKASGGETFQELAKRSDAVDAANGKSYEQPVYHGTPHKFDKFTTDHMGSGEGAQAFGWGLYFASDKAVAKHYREMLRHHHTDVFVDSKKASQGVTAEGSVHNSIAAHSGDLTAAIHEREAEIARLRSDASSADFESMDAVVELAKELVYMKSLAGRVTTEKGGRLYTVDIPDDGDYLLWGKPLKEQSANVQQAVDDAFRSSGNDEAISWLEVNQEHAATWRTAEETYVELSKVLGSDEAASKALLKFGAKGIKYLDGNSRSDGKGHHNYVIFDGADVAIKTFEQSLDQPGKKDPRGSIQFDRNRTTIRLFQAANLSTFLHESGHFFLEVLGNLASETNAAPDIVADHQKIRNWFGSNPDHIRSQAVDLALNSGAKDTVVVALRAMTDEQVAAVAQGFSSVAPDGSPESWLKDSMHEYFARGFEGYLLTGKAPQSSLRSVFARIKAWMVGIYRDISSLRVNLSPEMIDVFDRLVAAEDAVDAAEDRAGTTNTLPASTFATADEFDTYRIAVQASAESARDNLAGQLVEEYRKEARKAWAQKRDEIRAEVAEEVNGKPVYQVIAALQRGEMPDGTKLPDEYQGMKLDRAEIVREWGEDILGKLPGPGEGNANRGLHVYTENGLPLSQVAKAWKFTDAVTMIEAMIAAPDRRSLIDTTTTSRLNALVPDPMIDGSIEARADRSLSSDQRGELLAREMRALGQKTGQTPAPIAVLREVAVSTIARQKARDLRPDKYRMAASTAARRAIEAAGKQQWAEAYQFKQQQALNEELHKAARDAVEAGEKGRAYLRTFDTLAKRQRIGKAGGWEFSVFEEDGKLVGSFATVEEAKFTSDSAAGRTYRQTNGFLETINNILEGFQLRRPSNKSLRIRENVRKWMADRQERGEPVDIDPAVIDDLGSVNWNDLTAELQQSAVDAVKHVDHLASLANKLLQSNRKQELADARDEIVTEIVKHQPIARPDKITDDLPSRIKGSIVGFFEAHRKDSFLARKMDGYEAGGVNWDYFIRPRNEAAAAQETENAAQAQLFHALYRAWGKSPGNFAQAIAGTNLRLTTEERLCLAMNWGNAEGRQRVMMYLMRHGKNASDAQAVLESLDAKDWGLVNGVLGLINGHWSDIAALERRVNGLSPDKVEALPFNTKLGLQAGGYYPIKYDPKKSNKAGDLQAATEAKEMAQAAGARAQTRRGHTKLRAANLEGLALRLDFGVSGEHVAEVVHDLTHREMLIDQARLLRDGSISLTIKDHHGRGALDELTNTAADIATGDRPARHAAERFARFFRMNSSAATFGMNLTSALMNITGLSQSLARVGPGRMLWAVSRVTRDAAHMENSAKWVEGKSEFMKNRANTLIREVAEEARKIETGGTLADIRRWGYYPMTQVQRVVDTITWMAAHDQALADLHKSGVKIEGAESKAVAMADQVVIDTQGSGRVGDLAAFQRGGEISKLFTTFYSYFSVAANLQGEAIGRAWNNPQDPKNWLRLGTTTLLVWTLPALLSGMIKGFLQGDERDEKKKWERLIREQVSYGTGMLVGLREVSAGVELSAFGYSGPAGLRGVGTIVDAVGEIAQLKADKRMLKSLVSGVGTLTGLPSVQANRLIDAIEQYEESGDTSAATSRALFGAPRK